MTTVFEKIIEGALPAEKVFENEHLIVIKDIHPVAPVHLLIIPKKHFKDIQSIPAHEMYLIQEVVKAAQIVAEDFDVSDGYRLLTNNGSDAGQSVFHLHFHLIGGRILGHLA